MHSAREKVSYFIWDAADTAANEYAVPTRTCSRIPKYEIIK